VCCYDVAITAADGTTTPSHTRLLGQISIAKIAAVTTCSASNVDTIGTAITRRVKTVGGASCRWYPGIGPDRLSVYKSTQCSVAVLQYNGHSNYSIIRCNHIRLNHSPITSPGLYINTPIRSPIEGTMHDARLRPEYTDLLIPLYTTSLSLAPDHKRTADGSSPPAHEETTLQELPFSPNPQGAKTWCNRCKNI